MELPDLVSPRVEHAYCLGDSSMCARDVGWPGICAAPTRCLDHAISDAWLDFNYPKPVVRDSPDGSLDIGIGLDRPACDSAHRCGVACDSSRAHQTGYSPADGMSASCRTSGAVVSGDRVWVVTPPES
jgi:hypothetical protein